MFAYSRCELEYLHFTLFTVSLQHSWKWFIYYRCQNVNRNSKQDSGHRKRVKVDEHSHAHVFPPAHAEDEVSYGRNLELLQSELGKSKPRVEALKDLMKRTFPNRWKAYTCDNEPPSLLEYLSKFPLLKKASYVSLYNDQTIPTLFNSSYM